MTKDTLILGIETSCDETAASVVRNGRDVLSNVISSSLKDHQKYGGVIPEIASRRQLEFISIVVREALEQAGVSLSDLGCVAVTRSPGLLGSLLVGLSFARALAYARQMPLVEVDHIKAHLYANFLVPVYKGKKPSDIALPQLPAVGLVVSGGHSSLYELKTFSRIRLLGQTRDDAVGEAYDKVARIMNLGYPGGPAIDRLARSVTSSSVKFNCADMPGSYDFSFSGIKTAVLYHTRKDNSDPAGVARGFQDAVVGVLVKKSIQACVRRGIQTLVVGGGVAANLELRERLAESAAAAGIQVYVPDFALCTDNAAMIAGLGYHWQKGQREAVSR